MYVHTYVCTCVFTYSSVLPQHGAVVMGSDLQVERRKGRLTVFAFYLFS